MVKYWLSIVLSLVLLCLLFPAVRSPETSVIADGATTEVTVTKYAPDGTTVIAQETIDYQLMEAIFPVYGNGTTHYYFQGPTFDDSSFDALWDPTEMVNIDSRDYGAAKGTDVKDLCSIVGGAEPGSEIKIKAYDGFAKWFDYEDVYTPEPEQGKMIVTWYTKDAQESTDGYVGAGYTTGMRLLFFAETLNPDGKHVFGIWDMHETLAESRWHYYYDGKYWPSSSGLSVKYVRYIEIYPSSQTTYTLSIGVNGEGETDPPATNHTFDEGEVVTVTATPDSGWNFVNWTGDVADPDSATTTVTIDSDKTITANFAQPSSDKQLTMAVDGNGTTDPAIGAHTYSSGTVVDITATPDSGWQFVNWTGGIVYDANSATTTVTMDSDKTITANFTQAAKELTVEVEGEGTTTPAEGDHTYAEGATVNITATPDSGWYFVNWTGGTVASASSAATTVTMDDDKTVTANFTQATKELTIEVDGQGTTTPASGSHTYGQGATIDITATPASGWDFVGWTGDVADADAAATIVTMDEDQEITANFSQDTYNLTVSIEGNGTINPSSGSHKYTQNKVITMTATPAEGWEFVGWTGDVDDIDASSTTITIDSDKTVTATFAQLSKVEVTTEPDDTPAKPVDKPDQMNWLALLIIAAGVIVAIILLVAIIRMRRGY